MSLSDLMQPGWGDATATAAIPATHEAEKAGTVATVARVAVANPDDSSYGWLLSFPDGRVLKVFRTAPEATRDEVLKDFPGAETVEPYTPQNQGDKNGGR